MGRKYINRNDENDENDEKSSKSRIERLGPNIDDLDPMEVTYRNILIEKEQGPKPLTKEEIVKEEVRETGHQTRTTNQFQKYVNAHLSDRVSKINKIKEAKEKFDDEIKKLQTNEPLSSSELEQSAAELTSNTLFEMLESLKTNKEVTGNKIKQYRAQIKQAEEELFEQEMAIQKIEKELKRKKIIEAKNLHESSEIKNELTNLTEKYDVDELKRVLELLEKKNKE